VDMYCVRMGRASYAHGSWQVAYFTAWDLLGRRVDETSARATLREALLHPSSISMSDPRSGGSVDVCGLPHAHGQCMRRRSHDAMQNAAAGQAAVRADFSPPTRCGTAERGVL